MRNITIDSQNSDTWKNPLTIAINFISSKDAEEEHVIHSRSNNMKFLSYNGANEIIDELFESLHSNHQGNLETSMRGKDFTFDSVHVMYFKCHKVNFRRGGSHFDFPDWVRKKRAAINPKIKDDKFFNLHQWLH